MTIQQPQTRMNTYAVIESNSGYVWGIVDSSSALQACYDVDVQAGGHRGDGEYQPCSYSELRTTRGVYDVRIAPEGFSVENGQDRDDIDAVSALPRAGVFGWVAADAE